LKTPESVRGLTPPSSVKGEVDTPVLSRKRSHSVTSDNMDDGNPLQNMLIRSFKYPETREGIRERE
jgi:hypothetical protein